MLLFRCTEPDVDERSTISIVCSEIPLQCTSMGWPGWIEHPDGTKEFVEDTSAYSEQSQNNDLLPETTIDTKENTTQRNEEPKSGSDMPSTSANRSAPVAHQNQSSCHTCIGGKITETCQKCRGSSLRFVYASDEYNPVFRQADRWQRRERYAATLQ